MNWYLKVLKEHYADFNGRARRQEYWMFMLFHVIIALVFGVPVIISMADNDEPNVIFVILLAVYLLGTMIPSIALTVRRLHDIGKSGGWYFIRFVPYIGGIWLLALVCKDSENGNNEYGQNPKGLGNDDAINQIGLE